jgi:hypothetical protein
VVPAPPIVARPELVTPVWMTDVLRHGGAIGADSAVTALEAQPIGTGQVGANVRFRLDYDGEPGPASVVGKFASADPDSAAAGIATFTYETEVAFYRDLASSVDVSRPHCFFADGEPGTANVVLVLEDLAPAEQGDQLAGCTVEHAELAIDEAAKLHGPRWGDPRLTELPWLTRPRGPWALLSMLWEGFVDRYRDMLAPATVREGQRLLGALGALEQSQPVAPTAVHSDFRLDNLLFDPTSESRPITVVDWQTVHLGAGPADVAYFLGNAFADPEPRRANEERLVRRYHDALLGYGIEDYTFDQCWTEYRRAGYSSLIMAIIASMFVGRTERGDRMFMAMADRSAQMAADLDTYGALVHS